MKKFINSIAFTLFIICVCAFTISDKWYLFESTPLGFKVEFPAKPTEKTKPLSTLSGDLTINMFEYIAPKESTDLNQVYLASYIEYPEDIDGNNKDKQKELCRKVVDDVVTKLKGKLIKESIITLDGYEGVEARIEYKDGTEVLKMHMYLVHNKMYMLETSTLMAKDNNKSIYRFMNSFKLVK
jgi:hypothetical protein